MKTIKAVMLGGTGSDVGKSIIATGLCRIFLQDGYRPAPFKAQNMALNSYATSDGKEIGRAQAVQAEAAGIPCSTDMNPLLLKPSGEHTSQVVLNGLPIGNRDSYTYYRKEGRDFLRKEVHDAFDRLASQYNPIVMEGAGSIAEINLQDTDLVNMSMARYADAKVILVADIDRGGVFASAYGSIMLQTPEDRKRIKGIIVNKFRGDLRLFEKGRKMMEEVCGVPVLGVVPYAKDIHIEEEDSVALSAKNFSAKEGKVNFAVVVLDHISNYTDFDTVERHPSINLYYAINPDDLKDADTVILPGSKSTISDLKKLKETGMDKAINEAFHGGKFVIGICGGYQMLGETIKDSEGVEGEPCEIKGLGILPIATEMNGKKITRQIKFRFMNHEEPCEGYEIHNGRTSILDMSSRSVCIFADGDTDGCQALNGNAFGTYIHGILDNEPVINHILSYFPHKKDGNKETVTYKAFKEQQYDMLADHLRKHIDIPALYKILAE
ncbi:MAG: cobyric acid synthase [Lachnospiraceae bacterium]|nr:cobyric acid synthase [Lachnospiraceae bacterium]